MINPDWLDSNKPGKSVVDVVTSRIALLQFVSRRWRHLANGRRPGHAGKVDRSLVCLTSHVDRRPEFLRRRLIPSAEPSDAIPDKKSATSR